MVIHFPLMIKSSGGRIDIGTFMSNCVRFKNSACFREIFLFGVHILSVSINPRNIVVDKDFSVTEKFDFCFEVAKGMTREESIDFARKVESYFTLLLVRKNINPQSGFNYAEVDWLNFYTTNSFNDKVIRTTLSGKITAQLELNREQWNVTNEYDNVIFSNYYDGVKANSCISKYFHWFLIIEVIEHSNRYKREFTELLFAASELDAIAKQFKSQAKSETIKSLKGRTEKSRKRKLYETLQAMGVNEYSIYDEKYYLTLETVNKIIEYRNSLFHCGEKFDEMFMWHHFFPIVREIVDLLLKNPNLLD